MLDVTLAKLALTTSYTSAEVRMFLGLLKEIGAEDFVAQLCQNAYDLGYNDCSD